MNNTKKKHELYEYAFDLREILFKLTHGIPFQIRIRLKITVLCFSDIFALYVYIYICIRHDAQ